MTATAMRNLRYTMDGPRPPLPVPARYRDTPLTDCPYLCGGKRIGGPEGPCTNDCPPSRQEWTYPGAFTGLSGFSETN